MSLDFALTQFYRVLLDDIVLLYDTYKFYTSIKPYPERSIGEFTEVLANVTDQETQNLDEVEVKKVASEPEQTVGIIVWDYFHSVLIRYLLDDASQYPFWTAKMRIFFGKKPFGMPMLTAFQQLLHERFFHAKFRQMYAGFGPYLIASAAVNIDYLTKVTNNFIFSILSKIPSPPSLEDIRRERSHESNLLAHAKASIPGFVRPPSINWGYTKRDKEKEKPVAPNKSWIMSIATTMLTTFVSHPNLVVATHMAANPLCTGSPWAVSTIKILTDYGLGALYLGLKSRMFINLLPFTSYIIMAIADNILYRHIMAVTFTGYHRNNADIPLSISNSSTNGGGTHMITYLNYGLLTLAHVIPSFLSFLGMRAVSRIVFGCSIHRKIQRQRRKEMVETYMAKVKKIRDLKERKSI